jgi:hypothetical protein
MAFKSLNLRSFARGDDWTVQYTFKDTEGNPIDITGNTYWVTLKTAKDDADQGAAQVNITASGPDAINGIVIVAFDSSITTNLTPGTYYYDLQEVDLSGNVYTILLGKVRVVSDITRSTS